MGFREHVALQSLDGAVVVDARDEHLNPHGSVHGGLLATMLDVAMGNAVAEAGGERPVTVALSITYLEPGQRGRLSATARVRKRGKRLIRGGRGAAGRRCARRRPRNVLGTRLRALSPPGRVWPA